MGYYYKKRGELSFLLLLDFGRDGHSKRIRFTKTIKINDDALLKTTRKLDQYLQKELAKFEIEVKAGGYIAPEKNRFEDFVKEWRERYALHNYFPSIVKSYDSYLRNHILPAFDHKRIGEIKTIEIIRFLDDKLKGDQERKDGRNGNLSPGTVRKFHETLASIFKRAMVQKVIS
ncbi:tyrosine-type recombinase/integrase [Salimicrobium humidisoli]|nr:N-terminal phage integrase SAM-like domain-containing protein [Salimicrobium humidisoli]